MNSLILHCAAIVSLLIFSSVLLYKGLQKKEHNPSNMSCAPYNCNAPEKCTAQGDGKNKVCTQPQIIAPQINVCNNAKKGDPCLSQKNTKNNTKGTCQPDPNDKNKNKKLKCFYDPSSRIDCSTPLPCKITNETCQNGVCVPPKTRTTSLIVIGSVGIFLSVLYAVYCYYYYYKKGVKQSKV